MKKPVIRQLKKMKGGKELVVSVPPEIREPAGLADGDNLLLERDPDSGIVQLSKVDQSTDRQQYENRENAEDENRENESRVDLSAEEEQSQRDGLSKFEFCTSCGSDDIQVTGNQFYCGDCDVTYEVTPKGTKVVGVNPSEKINGIENRVKQLEQDVGNLNDKSGNDEDENSGVLFSLFGIDFGFVDGTEDDEDDEDLVPAGAEQDEEDEPDGFMTWS